MSVNYTPIFAFEKRDFKSVDMSFVLALMASLLAKTMARVPGTMDPSIGRIASYMRRRVLLRRTAVGATFFGATVAILTPSLPIKDLSRKNGEWVIFPFSMTSMNCFVDSLCDLLIMCCRPLYGDFLSAFAPARRQNLAASRGLHAHAEAVALGALTFVRLVGE